MNRFLIFIIAFIFISCKNNIEEVTEKPIKDYSENLNISVLIDLSDRIDTLKHPNPTMEYYVRDVGYINSISEAFMAHVNSKKIKQINDKIQVYFDPAPLNPKINSISNGLKFELTKDNVSTELLSTIKESYSLSPLKLYQLAIEDNNYVGADTWKFFQNKINDYCIDEIHRNIVIILTDGYIYFDNSLMKEKNRTSFVTSKSIRDNNLNGPDWSEKLIGNDLGFIVANEDLSDLEILVLGINPDSRNPYEEKIITAYWTKWFEEMKVKRYDIKTAELPTDMDRIIKNFILKK